MKKLTLRDTNSCLKTIQNVSFEATFDLQFDSNGSEQLSPNLENKFSSY